MELNRLPEHWDISVFFKFPSPKVNSILEKQDWASTDPSASVQVNEKDSPSDRENLCSDQVQAHSFPWAPQTSGFSEEKVCSNAT